MTRSITRLTTTRQHHPLASRQLAQILLVLAVSLLTFVAPLSPHMAYAEDQVAAPGDDGVSFSSSDLRPDAADPCMIKVGGVYYLFATTDNHYIPYYASTDLKTWTYAGNLLTCSGFEGTGLSRGDIWAPEVRERTVGGRTTYVLTYTAANYWDSQFRICVAEANEIAPGAFGRPMTIDTGSVRNAIDSDLYFEGNDVWCYFKNEDEYHSLCVERLGPGWSRASNPKTVLRMDQAWETWTIEGPWVIKWGRTYYLMYSSGGYTTGRYCIGYATSNSPDGPFTKQTKSAPLVQSASGVIGPGHNSTLMVADGEIYLVYHSLFREGAPDRRLMMDRMGIDDKGRMFVNFAGFGRQPLPSGTQGYYQVPGDDYSVSAHGEVSVALSDVASSQSGSGVQTVEASEFQIDVADGYKVTDVWLFGTRSGLRGTADLLINDSLLATGYRLSGEAAKLTLPVMGEPVRSIEVRLSSSQSLSEILLVSRGRAFEHGNASLPEGTYAIQSNMRSGLVLDNAGDSKVAGSNVLVWEYNGKPNQKWRLTYDDAGLATLVNVSSGMALDVTYGSNAYGTNIEQWDNIGSTAQKWSLEDNGDGTVTLLSAVGGNMVADVERASANNGSNVLLWSVSGANNQRWRFVPVDVDVTTDGLADIQDGYYTLRPQCAPNCCLDVAGASMADGGNLVTWTANGTSNQCFKVERTDDGFYCITNALSRKAVDVAGGSPFDGANVVQWESKGSSNQKWAIYEHSDGTYTLRNVGSGLMLDVTGASSSAGTNVEGWSANGSSAQAWRLEPASDPWQKGIELAASNKDALAAGTYTIGSTVDARLVFDVAWASKDGGSNVALWSGNGGANQSWDVSYDEDGFATLLNVNSGLALTLSAVMPCGNVVQQADTGAPNQKWIIVDNGNGSFTLSCAIDTNFVADVYGNSHREGTNIEVYPNLNNAAQRFAFTPVKPAVAPAADGGELLPAADVPATDVEELVLEDSGYVIAAGNAELALAIKNPNKDAAPKEVSISVEVKAQDGTTRLSEDWKVGLIEPGETAYCARELGGGQLQDTDTLNVKVTVEDGGWIVREGSQGWSYVVDSVKTSPSEKDPSTLTTTGTIALAGEVAQVDGKIGLQVEGKVAQPTQPPTLVCVLKDAEGKIVCGYSHTLEEEVRAAEEPTPFAFDAPLATVDYASSEVHVNL